MHGSHWGAFHPRVVGGRFVEAVPFAKDADPSPLLESMPGGVHAANRIAAPAVRRGWLEGERGGPVGRRGAQQFVEISWDTALDLVASEVARVHNAHGPEAVFGGSYGWSSAGRFHHAKSLVSRFLALTGGYVGQISNYSWAAADAILPHVVGDSSAVQGGVATWGDIAEHTDTLLMFGGAPAKNLQVEPGGVGRHNARLGLLRALDSGTRLINVNPVRTDAPDHPNVEWLPIRPGTDVALILALSHTLLVTGRYDREFVGRYTTGFDRYADYLMGRDRGVAYDAAWAAGITSIPETDILALADRLTRGRVLVTSTWSLQRADHGEQPYWGVVALAAMLGHIGLRGGGFGFGYGCVSGTGTYRRRYGVPSARPVRNPVRNDIPVARIADMLLDPGGTYEFNGERRRYPEIRLIYWAGGNPFHHHQDLNRFVEAWQRPDTIVVHEPWWTSTAQYADIVLPATTTLERDDIGASSRDPFVVALKRAIDPVGQARNDYDIFRELSRRLGVEEAFTGGMTADEGLRAMYEDAAATSERAGVPMPSFDEFWERGWFEFDIGSTEIPLGNFRADPDAAPLSTPSGRIELFSETIHAFGYDDCPGHPTWLEPREWASGGPGTDHPIHLLSPQPRSRLHSQLDMGVVSLATKIKGHEPCVINSSDAAERGIRDGDVIRVYNGRGALLAGARVSDDVIPGVALLATGAWYQASDPATPSSLEVHGNPNVLTPDRGTSRLAQGPSAQSVMVQIEYCEEDHPVTPHRVPPLRRRSGIQ